MTIKRRDATGTVWERIDKRMVEIGDYHWCHPATSQPIVDAPELVDGATMMHVCGIWRKSSDQTWQPPEIPPSSRNPIDELIERLTLTVEMNGENIPVLAMLYQSQTLGKMEFTQRELLRAVERIANVQESRRSIPFEALVYTLVAWLLGIVTALAFHIKP